MSGSLLNYAVIVKMTDIENLKSDTSLLGARMIMNNMQYAKVEVSTSHMNKSSNILKLDSDRNLCTVIKLL